MTPIEKSKELIDKFTLPFSPNIEEAKLCALIAVDEIIELRKGYFDCTNPMNDESYWQEVKQEIKNN
jgi:hypothetical protein